MADHKTPISCLIAQLLLRTHHSCEESPLLTQIRNFCIILQTLTLTLSHRERGDGVFPVQLHEQTQRFILLLIFYLFGPILTLGIIGGIALRKHSSHARYWERTLTQQTGLHWKIESVEYRSPSFIRLHNVRILDDIAQDTLFLTKQINVQRITDTSRSKNFPDIASSDAKKTGLTGLVARTFPSFYSADWFWRITVPFSALNFGKYSSEESALLVQNLLRKVVARLDTLSEVPVQFVFEEIAVISEHSRKKEGKKIEDQIDLFRFVQGNIYRTSTGIQSDWAFQIKGVPDIDRHRLSFALSQETLDVSFRSGLIPCDLAAVFCSSFKHFSGGTFQGEFALSTQIGTHSQTIRLNQAVFWNMPLAPLVQPYTTFAVEGTVSKFELTRAVFGPEGLYAKGHLQVANGAIEKALFHRCIDNFQVSLEPGDAVLDSQMPMVPFTACAILFTLQPQGIDFYADQIWLDRFMYYEEEQRIKWVAKLPENRQIVTYHELMSIFAPDNAPTVPLTHGIKDILPYIPTR